MLLMRRQRSTFHLGEEDGVHRRSTQRVKSIEDAVVGLRILVLLSTSRAACAFLSSCFLCRRELSLDKDVYMYRGDQGFCSKECRRQQILRDEARERDAVIKKRWQGVSSIQQHHGGHGWWQCRWSAVLRGDYWR